MFLTMSTRRCDRSVRGCLLLRSTWSHLYLLSGQYCSALNFYFAIWILEMVDSFFLSFFIVCIVFFLINRYSYIAFCKIQVRLYLLYCDILIRKVEWQELFAKVLHRKSYTFDSEIRAAETRFFRKKKTFWRNGNKFSSLRYQ